MDFQMTAMSEALEQPSDHDREKPARGLEHNAENRAHQAQSHVLKRHGKQPQRVGANGFR